MEHYTALVLAAAEPPLARLSGREQRAVGEVGEDPEQQLLW